MGESKDPFPRAQASICVRITRRQRIQEGVFGIFCARRAG
jgi:hypothetical protein